MLLADLRYYLQIGYKVLFCFVFIFKFVNDYFINSCLYFWPAYSESQKSLLSYVKVCHVSIRICLKKKQSRWSTSVCQMLTLLIDKIGRWFTIFFKSLLDQISDAVPSGFVNYLIRRIHDRNRNLKKTQLGNKKPYSTIFLFRIISIPSKVCYFRLPDHMILMEC